MCMLLTDVPSQRRGNTKECTQGFSFEYSRAGVRTERLAASGQQAGGVSHDGLRQRPPSGLSATRTLETGGRTICPSSPPCRQASLARRVRTSSTRPRRDRRPGSSSTAGRRGDRFSRAQLLLRARRRLFLRTVLPRRRKTKTRKGTKSNGAGRFATRWALSWCAAREQSGSRRPAGLNLRERRCQVASTKDTAAVSCSGVLGSSKCDPRSTQRLTSILHHQR